MSIVYITNTVQEKWAFEGAVINGVCVHAMLAFETEDLWIEDVIGRAIPEMGEKYMELFTECKFNIGRFLLSAQKLDLIDDSRYNRND